MKLFTTPSAQLISQILRIILYGFKSIGLAPFSLHFRARTRNSDNTSIRAFLCSKMGLLYNLVFSILVQLMVTLVIPNTSTMIYSKNFFVNRTTDGIRYIFFISTTWFIIVYWGFRQEKAAAIMNRLLDVHCLLSSPKELQQLSSERTLRFIAIHLIFNTILWVVASISAFIHFQSVLTTFANNFPIFIIYWFLIEYSLILDIVAREFEILNNNLLNLKNFSNSLFFPSLSNEHLDIISLSARNELAALKLLHSLRTTLFEVSQLVAEFFSLPILPSIACFSLVLIYNFYFLITPIVTPISDLSIVSNIGIAAVWIFLSIYPLFSLSSNVTKTMKKAKLTRQLVHKLLATARKQEIITELRHFSLHLMHEDICFTAHGFFALDFTLLQSIFGASATYLIIIIQFTQPASQT